jgi:hypothetical protein
MRGNVHMRGTDNERGSLASYIIVGVVLVLILVSGLYGVQRFRDARQEVAGNDDSAAQDKTNSSTSEDDKTAPAKTKSQAADSTDKSAGDMAGSATEDSTSGAETADLPATGPDEAVLNGLAIGALTFAAASFIRSRLAGRA